jgi:hypothetical protein
VTFDSSPPAAREHLKSAVQTAKKFCRTQRDDPSGGELDRHALSARRQDGDTGAGPFEIAHQYRGGAKYVLAVVQEEQYLLVSKHLDQRFQERRPSAVVAERSRDGLGDAIGITNRRQLNQPCAVALVGQKVRGDLKRQPGLADTADSGDRHNSRVLQCSSDLRHFGLATDE